VGVEVQGHSLISFTHNRVRMTHWLYFNFIDGVKSDEGLSVYISVDVEWMKGKWKEIFTHVQQY